MHRVLFGAIGKKFRAHGTTEVHDKGNVTALRRQAGDLFQTAERGKGDQCSFSILVGHDGAFRMLPSSGWDLEALRVHYGARSAFTVTREHGAVRLQARDGAESLLLGKGEAQQSRHSWTVDCPQYRLVPPANSNVSANRPISGVWG